MRFIMLGPQPAMFRAGAPLAARLAVTALLCASALICGGAAIAGACACFRRMKRKDWGGAALALAIVLLAGALAVPAAGAAVRAAVEIL